MNPRKFLADEKMIGVSMRDCEKQGLEEIFVEKWYEFRAGVLYLGEDLEGSDGLPSGFQGKMPFDSVSGDREEVTWKVLRIGSRLVEKNVAIVPRTACDVGQGQIRQLSWWLRTHRGYHVRIGMTGRSAALGTGPK